MNLNYVTMLEIAIITDNMSNIEVKEVVQLKVVLEHVPGSLARVAEALRDADINIEGTCNMEGYDDNMPLRLVVDKPEEAKKAIEAKGDPVTTEHAICIQNFDDMPGFIAAVARKLADAKINIEAIYHASSGRSAHATMFVSVDPVNVKGALEALAGL